VLVLYGLVGTTGAVLAIPVYLSAKLVFKNILKVIEHKKKNAASRADEDSFEEDEE
jgi:hypothetical protein